jgi:hypothetical protein
VLAYSALILYLSADIHVLVLIMAVVFILVIGAADVAWDLLVPVSHERTS